MKTMQQPFTRVDWERLPEGFPAQLIQGQLVKEPAPTYGHQRLGARIRFALLSLLGPDRVPDTPADVLVDDVNVYQPDVVVLRAPADDASHYVGVPLLAVEVLSRSTRKRDRDVKAERLLVLGVEEVWLVDPETQSIEVRSAEDRRLATLGEELRSRAVPGFVLDLDTLFSPPHA
jgi:Uma2 family endonuclease